MKRTLQNITNYTRRIYPKERILERAIEKALNKFNVRDPFDRIMLECEIHFEIRGTRCSPSLPVTLDNDLYIRWTTRLHAFGVDFKQAMYRALDQFLDPHSEKRKTLCKIIGDACGFHGAPRKKSLERERFVDEHQSTFDSLVPPSAPH